MPGLYYSITNYGSNEPCYIDKDQMLFIFGPGGCSLIDTVIQYRQLMGGRFEKFKFTNNDGWLKDRNHKQTYLWFKGKYIGSSPECKGKLAICSFDR